MSYYKTIDGVKMDAALLEAADEAVAGRGDGRISIADADMLLEPLVRDRCLRAFDGGLALAGDHLPHLIGIGIGRGVLLLGVAEGPDPVQFGPGLEVEQLLEVVAGLSWESAEEGRSNNGTRCFVPYP